MENRRQIVLCVDDDPDDQQMAMESIMAIDPTIRVVTALNGVEALRFLSTSRQQGEFPCLIILDINMPVMDGKQSLTKIKKDKELAHVPVVLFTTSSSPLDKSFAEQHGVAFVTKPISYGELHSTVHRLLTQCAK